MSNAIPPHSIGACLVSAQYRDGREQDKCTQRARRAAHLPWSYTTSWTMWATRT